MSSPSVLQNTLGDWRTVISTGWAPVASPKAKERRNMEAPTGLGHAKRSHIDLSLMLMYSCQLGLYSHFSSWWTQHWYQPLAFGLLQSTQKISLPCSFSLPPSKIMPCSDLSTLFQKAIQKNKLALQLLGLCSLEIAKDKLNISRC